MKFMKDPITSEEAKNHKYIRDCLVFDTETDSLDVESAKMKWFGAYSYKHEKYFICDFRDASKIQKLLDEHKVLVTFNGKLFDQPIMSNNGFDLNYKISVDCYQVLYNPKMNKDNRKTIIKLKDGRHLDAACKSNSLRSIANILELPSQKGEIDYKLFFKDTWTDEEIKLIEKYLFADLETTRALFEFYLDYFKGFKDLVNETDIKNFNYIRCSTGAFAYSAISKAIGKDPIYPPDDRLTPERFEGGFVLLPTEEYAENVLVFDFASLYPHIQVMCNLYSPVNMGGWPKFSMFETFGKYEDKQHGTTEKALHEIYKMRSKLKSEKNESELGYKIVINSIYGISSSPIFINVYNPTVAKDTTFIGRQMVKFAINQFELAGFKVIAADTDSCFIVLGSKTKEEALKIADNIKVEILKNVPFPVDTFYLKLEKEILKIWFPGKQKKHYAYIETNGKFSITGLEIIKGNATLLGQEVLKQLYPLIEKNKDMKFKRYFIEKIVSDLISRDISLVGSVYKVKDVTAYKSDSSIQAQMSKIFGPGEYIMIPNKTLGEIGKSKKYCTVEESKKLTFEDLFLDKFWNEMAPFTEE